MPAVRRLADAARALALDPVGRRAYLARLRWLMQGTGRIPAWSLEYRAGLTGRYAVEAERLSMTSEQVMSCPDDCAARAALTHLYERRCVYRLRGTRIATASGATVATGPAGPFFVRESISWPHESIVTHGLDAPDPARPAKSLAGPVIAFPTTANYYHWLIEDLPAVLRAAAAEPRARLIAFRDGVTERHRIVAAHAGRALDPVAHQVAASEQVLAGRADGNWFAHPEDVALLAALGNDLAGSDGSATDAGARLYISRRRARRSFATEATVEDRLRAAGFRVIVLEEIPWLQQIAAFRAARVIVGPHGAGLANLAFTAPGATVVELVDGAIYNRCYEWLCHVAGHDYRLLPVEAAMTGDEILGLIGA